MMKPMEHREIPILRTPDERFQGLPEFPFAPHYATVIDHAAGPLRMHYVDEGEARRGVVLMLHGEPTWSYLYRKMIRPVASAGWRVIAPDHIGFGRSDKIADRSFYSYDRYVAWLRAFIETVGLDRIVLVCQDWGGPIGLRLLSEQPERFAGVFATNTLLPNCQQPPLGAPGWPGAGITSWMDLCRTSQDLAISEVIAATFLKRPDPAVLAAYDAPFPDPSYKAAALALTCLIPATEDAPGVAENRAAWKVLENWTKPFATAFSDADPATAAWEAVFRARIPGAAIAPHVRIRGAGHFVQDEQGEMLARALCDFLEGL